MHFSKKLTLFVLFLVVSLNQISAQRGGRNMDPKQMAERQTTMMKDSLFLSEAQVEKVAAVNLLYANKMDEERKKMRDNSDGDWETMRSKMRTTMQTLRSQQKEDLQKYLTSEQFEKWEKIEIAQREKRRGRGRGEGKRRGKRKREKKETENN